MLSKKKIDCYFIEQKKPGKEIRFYNRGRNSVTFSAISANQYKMGQS